LEKSAAVNPPDRSGLLKLLGRADELDAHHVELVNERLSAIESGERVEEWRRLKAVECKRRAKEARMLERQRKSSVHAQYTEKEERNVAEYAAWTEKKKQPPKDGSQPRKKVTEDEQRRLAVAEALRVEAEVRTRDKQAVAKWAAKKTAEQAELRIRDSVARRALDSSMALRRLETEMMVKNLRFNEPCELYVSPVSMYATL